jgi:hypothetical protein
MGCAGGGGLCGRRDSTATYRDTHFIASTVQMQGVLCLRHCLLYVKLEASLGEQWCTVMNGYDTCPVFACID